MPTLDAKAYLEIALAAFAIFYLARLVISLRAERRDPATAATFDPRVSFIATGFGTNFFDTLGIGSFATTAAIWKNWRLVKDEQIPGTLNVGHTLPTIVQAFIFFTLVQVDALTLILMIGAAVAGSWLGAGLVSRWSRRWIQIGMGGALFAAAVLMLLKQLNIGPAGGDLLAVTGVKLGIAIAVNMILGALMTLGIGLYAPCMILVSLLGMNPIAAFPIMMGSCAFLMPVASSRFMRARRFHPAAALGLLFGGVPAVVIAAPLVSRLSIDKVRWVVIAVVVYTAVVMLRSAYKERGAAAAAPAAAPVA